VSVFLICSVMLTLCRGLTMTSPSSGWYEQFYSGQSNIKRYQRSDWRAMAAASQPLSALALAGA
jgi:hypothetical protein